MDKKQFSNKQIKVGGTTGVEPVSIEYKDKDYILKTYSENKASVTGHVVIAELFSNNDKLPKFIFRWDHGAGVVDVDIFIEGKDRKDLWTQKGYQGHWTKLTDDKNREYLVSIEIPERKIFKGIVRVGLLTELNLSDSIAMSENLDIKII
ncbi:hypothetical protein COU87_01110 [Candidatus Roizmanbacteria bacterium CG10_big_fil_rev_8_21_14_0_10_39_12]|uniref:Uncharacterized protein n=1 Tax=Candidatus Roizmanbacteria bacterium CG10_big_fil_rev_8_21_14_0_10_39_12 TaxID=1974852 RepID=A0A2M8KQB6_9BACT|nr:MAG: hypothetical protein COY15_01520 [Candidatus Roizmanbacteria bacterium CG_4_10_14_0_2_um_filter_39_12]PJE62088.1 MAG: hypothetical protein COU87_01110 [Candidatus Roizmanbacteria bacterium CG10_big_fil_rev_8_21_14_0_10_39_12]